MSIKRAARQGLTEVFARDHRRIDGFLASLITAANAPDLVRADGSLSSLTDALRRHVDIEDRLLFGPFENSTGMRDSGPTVVMRSEHREIERRLLEMAQLLRKDGKAQAVALQAQALKALLDDHSRREEGVLYPACERVLDSAQLQVAIDALLAMGKEAIRT